MIRRIHLQVSESRLMTSQWRENANRNQSTEQKAKIVGMADAGMTPTDIASKLDVGRGPT
ncbi:hypothetical protein PGTUg99_000014, partial [Puccinia graminis f. sp. tritici]